MFDSIYNNCDPSPKKISCFCGEAGVKMSNGRPRRVTECCCVDCFQLLEWDQKALDAIKGQKTIAELASEYGVQISMDGKGRCMDNIFIDRLWSSVKYVKIFLEEFETVPELLSGLKEYFEFYNFERPHQSLVGKTLAEIYWGREVARKAA